MVKSENLSSVVPANDGAPAAEKEGRSPAPSDRPRGSASQSSNLGVRFADEEVENGENGGDAGPQKGSGKPAIAWADDPPDKVDEKRSSKELFLLPGRASDGAESGAGEQRKSRNRQSMLSTYSRASVGGTRNSVGQKGRGGGRDRGGRLSLWGEMDPEELEKELEEAARGKVQNRIAEILESPKIARTSIIVTGFYAVFAFLTLMFAEDIEDLNLVMWVAWTDLILLSFFLVEIILFSVAYGASFIFDPWNVLDLVVVVFSLIISCAALLLGFSSGPPAARSLLRMLRIVVLFRRLSERGAAMCRPAPGCPAISPPPLRSSFSRCSSS
jgi:hypothetical protein